MKLKGPSSPRRFIITLMPMHSNQVYLSPSRPRTSQRVGMAPSSSCFDIVSWVTRISCATLLERHGVPNGGTRQLKMSRTLWSRPPCHLRADHLPWDLEIEQALAASAQLLAVAVRLSGVRYLQSCFHHHEGSNGSGLPQHMSADRYPETGAMCWRHR